MFWFICVVIKGTGNRFRKKLRAYNLQDQGLDTVDANLQSSRSTGRLKGLFFRSENSRRLGINKVRLLTNNPKKQMGLDEAGVDVVTLSSFGNTAYGGEFAIPANKTERLKYIFRSWKCKKISSLKVFSFTGTDLVQFLNNVLLCKFINFLIIQTLEPHCCDSRNI